MIRKAFAAALLGLAIATPASADLFVSGDTNILDLGIVGTGNDAFLTNLAGASGGTIIVQTTTTPFLTTQAQEVVNFFNANGYTATLLSAGTQVTATDLSGLDLFISVGTDDAFTASEQTAFAAFLSGGGNLLLTGENSDPLFANTNSYINALLLALGSGMAISPATINPGFNTANLQGPSPYLTGTTGFQFAATSVVTGGVGLFGTTTGNTTFLAVEPTGAVPEPATWAMMLLGFGMAGLAFRRRKASSAIHATV